jgi:AhpD family alkylhydroperoxidase
LARLRYLTRADLSSEEQFIFDRLEKERPVPTGNIFRALAHAPKLLDAFLSYASAIRQRSELDAALRELAILTVGVTTDCKYEVAHHRRHALKAGLTREQYEAVSIFESSSLFSTQQKAVMRFARELTLRSKVSDENWKMVKDLLGDRQTVELLLNVGWYNAAVRFMGAIEIDLEEGEH